MSEGLQGESGGSARKGINQNEVKTWREGKLRRKTNVRDKERKINGARESKCEEKSKRIV